jgi:hypothetical protein
MGILQYDLTRYKSASPDGVFTGDELLPLFAPPVFIDAKTPFAFSDYHFPFGVNEPSPKSQRNQVTVRLLYTLHAGLRPILVYVGAKYFGACKSIGSLESNVSLLTRCSWLHVW